MTLPRVLIADDHILLAEAFRKLLEPHYNVVEVFTDGLALLRGAPALKPDVIVLDVIMPLMSGLQAGRKLKALLPSVKLIFVTMNEDPDVAREAMELRASGYVLKSSAAGELFEAIKLALKGRTHVSPQIARGLQENFIRKPEGEHHEKTLTPRQREVLQLLAEGKSMKQAADVLEVTPRTIAFHKYRMMEHLGIKNNSDLFLFAIKNHIRIT
jgi:DNA-binding NarL/FixJ family response regulator